MRIVGQGHDQEWESTCTYCKCIYRFYDSELFKLPGGGRHYTECPRCKAEQDVFNYRTKVQ